MGSVCGTVEARRRKLFANCDLLGLSKEERLDLARVILWRDIESFKDLDDSQIQRLLDATEGAEKVIALYRLRV